MRKNLEEESNKLEYKSSLPNDNLRWLKTIVSFSNTSGGRMIIGIDDETKQVVGVTESRSKLECKIMDTIYSSISPIPIVDLRFKNINDKDVLIIQTARGHETPYYIKSRGIVEGTYVRFGSTDRVATQSQIEELRLTSIRKSFSGTTYKNESNERHEVSEDELSEFLIMVNEKNVLKNINENKLLEWDLIENTFENNFATNGYMLLKNNPFSYAYVKLGIFEGTTKANLKEEKVFAGSIIEQYENVVDSIKDFLHKGYIFRKTRARDYYIPEEVIREIVANAIVHRNYSDEHPIRIEIYSDRMSVFSPGSLFDGLQLEDMLCGVSKLRNRNIAEIFYSFGFIEKWGSGIQRSNQILEEEGMQQLKIDTESIHGVTVTVYFEKLKLADKVKEDEIPTTQQVLDYYTERHKKFTRKEIEEDFNINEYYARKIIETLTEEKRIEKAGGGPSSYYVIV